MSSGFSSLSWQETWTGWGMSLRLTQEQAWWSVSQRAWRTGTPRWWSSYELCLRGTGFHATHAPCRPIRSPCATSISSTGWCLPKQVTLTVEQCLLEQVSTDRHHWGTASKTSDRHRSKQSIMTDSGKVSTRDGCQLWTLLLGGETWKWVTLTTNTVIIMTIRRSHTANQLRAAAAESSSMASCDQGAMESLSPLLPRTMDMTHWIFVAVC